MSNYDYRAIDTLGSRSAAYSSTAEGIGVWLIIALILALIGSGLVYFLFVNSKATPKNKFLKWLKDFFGI